VADVDHSYLEGVDENVHGRVEGYEDVADVGEHFHDGGPRHLTGVQLEDLQINFRFTFVVKTSIQ